MVFASGLPSRGRGTSRTSAIDLALPPDVPVTSTVTGTVVRAETYALYGRLPDLKVGIAPDGRPDVEVVHLHLNAITVSPGDRVVAGETVIATGARQLPFRSQIDKVAGKGPHVHVEIRPAGE